MTADMPGTRWAEAAAEFLKDCMWWDTETGCWSHKFTTVYQIGCEALIALGYADEHPWGAVPRAEPRLPDPLPRWDDICAAVLGLAWQLECIRYYRPDGSMLVPGEGSFTGVDGRGRPVPQPNILPAHGLGAAHAYPDTLSTLQHLGLVDGDRWTSAAEPVLWRDGRAVDWDIDLAGDSRFQAAIAHAVATMPDEIRATFARLAAIPDADVAEKARSFDLRVARDATSAARGQRRGGQVKRAVKILKGTIRLWFARHRRLSPARLARQRRSMQSMRRGELDWLFYRRWRLADGWLDAAEAGRGVEIFVDPLATAARAVVAARLHPEAPFLAADG